MLRGAFLGLGELRPARAIAQVLRDAFVAVLARSRAAEEQTLRMDSWVQSGQAGSCQRGRKPSHAMLRPLGAFCALHVRLGSPAQRVVTGRQCSGQAGTLFATLLFASLPTVAFCRCLELLTRREIQTGPGWGRSRRTGRLCNVT